jgi:SnoaL-like domain
MTTVVERYLETLQEQNWEALGATLSPKEFRRIGPFCDTLTSKTEYIKFLAGVVPILAQYQLRTRRIVAGDSAEGSSATVYAEINESFVANGSKMDFPEVLVFDLGADGLITQVQVYMMRPGEDPALPGAKAQASTPS